MKLARELSKRQTGRTLYLLDEPTTGLHFDDVQRLLEVLHRLTDLGNTVTIIEHNLDIIRNADYILDMGPEGGEGGGMVVAHGTPEEVATVAASYTGQFLAGHFNSREGAVAVVTSLRHAGAQAVQVTAPDKDKSLRGNFVAPQKKMGMPTAKAGGSETAKPESKRAAKKVKAR